jgi:predicted house-cleaning noncanonical NTP pyrophosphatase (MazG superfamily)
MIRVIEDSEWEKLVYIKDTLHETGEILASDQCRDLASLLSVILAKIDKLGDFTDRFR